MKDKRIGIGLAALAALVMAAIYFMARTGIFYPLEYQMSLGYKYLKEGNYEKAILTFDKAIKIDDKRIELYVGKAQAEIKLDKLEAALRTIEKAVVILEERKQETEAKSKTEESKEKLLKKEEKKQRKDSMEIVEETPMGITGEIRPQDWDKNLRILIKWWIQNSDPSHDAFEQTLKTISENYPDIIFSYEWGKVLYETKEPYRGYQKLYINKKERDKISYRDEFATAKWINEGYEEKEPYEEIERLYLNDMRTDEIRYTGRRRVSLNESQQKIIGLWVYVGPRETAAFDIDKMIFYEDGRVECRAMRLFYTGSYEILDENTLKITCDNNRENHPFSYDGDDGHGNLENFTCTLEYDADGSIYITKEAGHILGYTEGDVYNKSDSRWQVQGDIYDKNDTQ